MRQHLKVDAGLIHLLEAQLVEIVKASGNHRQPGFTARAARGDGIEPGKMPCHLGVEIVFFEGNDLGLCRHRGDPFSGGRSSALLRAYRAGAEPGSGRVPHARERIRLYDGTSVSRVIIARSAACTGVPGASRRPASSWMTRAS